MNPSPTPLNISAVIPSYNNAEFVAAAVASIRRQTVPVTEIIVVDDGSTDATQEVVERMTPPVVYLKQTNQGPSAARNAGIRAARYDWIAFLDADDQWTPNKIEKQIAVIRKNPELALVAGDMAEIDNDNRTITESVLAKHHLLEKFRAIGGGAVPNALAELVGKNFIPTGTVLVSKAALAEAGNFNPAIRFGEDLELWAKIAARHPIACLPEILMLRRQHGNNATQLTAPLLEDLVRVMESIRDYAAEQLAAQGVDPDHLVAGAYTALGYWNFSNYNLAKARRAFAASLKQRPGKRALFYWCSCLLPRWLIRTLREAKQLPAALRNKTSV